MTDFLYSTTSQIYCFWLPMLFIVARTIVYGVAWFESRRDE